MSENEIKLLWQATNEKFEVNLLMNKKNLEDVTRLKVQHVLSSMRPIKLFTLIVGILWVFGLGSLLIFLMLHHWGELSTFFICSAIIQVLLTAIAIGFYFYQMNLIHTVDFSKPVVAIQENVSKLKISTLTVTRLLFLQLPVWTTFYWNEKMFNSENGLWWILQGIVTLSFVYLACWLFFNIKYENRNKKWFQFIFNGKEWQPILQSMELLQQIETYQKQDEENSSV